MNVIFFFDVEQHFKVELYNVYYRLYKGILASGAERRTLMNLILINGSGFGATAPNLGTAGCLALSTFGHPDGTIIQVVLERYCEKAHQPASPPRVTSAAQVPPLPPVQYTSREQPAIECGAR